METRRNWAHKFSIYRLIKVGFDGFRKCGLIWVCKQGLLAHRRTNNSSTWHPFWSEPDTVGYRCLVLLSPQKNIFVLKLIINFLFCRMVLTETGSLPS